MKLTITFLLAALFSSSAMAVCVDHSATLRFFFNRLATERDFAGRRVEITMTGDTPPVADPLRGELTFTRSGNTVRITGASCGPLPDDQCQELEPEVWRYNPIDRCLYVDGNQATVISSTKSGLEYQYGKGRNYVRGNFRFAITRNLVINKTIQTPSRIKWIWFSGR